MRKSDTQYCITVSFKHLEVLGMMLYYFHSWNRTSRKSQRLVPSKKRQSFTMTQNPSKSPSRKIHAFKNFVSHGLWSFTWKPLSIPHWVSQDHVEKRELKAKSRKIITVERLSFVKHFKMSSGDIQTGPFGDDISPLSKLVTLYI